MHHANGMMDVRIAKLAKLGLLALEVATLAILVALAVLAVLGLLMDLPGLLRPPFLSAAELVRVVDHVLAVFVVIELLATAVAYIRGRDVVRRIFEAMLVALARKLISLDLAAASLEKVGALCLLLVALAVAWLLVSSIHEPADTGAEQGQG